jgi:hypothetical protein
MEEASHETGESFYQIVFRFARLISQSAFSLLTIAQFGTGSLGLTIRIQ